MGLCVMEESLSEVCPEIHRKKHFSEIQETPESLAGVSPAEGGGRGGLAHSQAELVIYSPSSAHLSKKIQTSQIATF